MEYPRLTDPMPGDMTDIDVLRGSDEGLGDDGSGFGPARLMVASQIELPLL